MKLFMGFNFLDPKEELTGTIPLKNEKLHSNNTIIFYSTELSKFGISVWLIGKKEMIWLFSSQKETETTIARKHSRTKH